MTDINGRTSSETLPIQSVVTANETMIETSGETDGGGTRASIESTFGPSKITDPIASSTVDEKLIIDTKIATIKGSVSADSFSINRSNARYKSKVADSSPLIKINGDNLPTVPFSPIIASDQGSMLSSSLASRDDIVYLTPSSPKKTIDQSNFPPQQLQSHGVSPINLSRDILVDLCSMKLAGLWGHPILRSYLLIYLLERQLHPIFFFLLDVSHFKSNFTRLTTTNRKTQATAIYGMYIGDENSSLSVPRVLHSLESEIDSKVERMIAECSHNCINAPKQTIFDDFEKICVELLNDYMFPQSERVNDSSSAAGENFCREFFSSAQYQMMERDLFDCRILTSRHVERIIQRLLDMPSLYYYDSALLIVNHLDALCLGDWRNSLSHSNRKLLSICAAQISSVQKQTSAKTLDRGGLKLKNAVKIVDESDGASSSISVSSLNNNRYSTISPHNNNFNSVFDRSTNTVENHTFVKYVSSSSSSSSRSSGSKAKILYCEYCFKPLVQEKQAFQCDGCLYLCHKNCRSSINISCISTSDDDGIPNFMRSFLNNSGETVADIVYKAHLKLVDLQNEIRIAENIRDGLEKMVKAKSESPVSPKSHLSSTADLLKLQLNESEKKLKTLERDYQKHQLYFAIAVSKLHVDISEEGNLKLTGPKSGETNPGNEAKTFCERIVENELSQSMSFCLELQAPAIKNTTNEACPKVVLKPPRSLGTAKEILQTFFDDSSVSTNADIYLIRDSLGVCQETPNGDLHFFNDDDRPFAFKATLKLNEKLQIAKIPRHFDMKTSHSKLFDNSNSSVYSTRNDKQKAAMMELVDTESNYVENLKSAIKYLMIPLSNSGIIEKPLIQEIFSNIQTLVNVHSKILELMKGNHENSIEVFANILTERVPLLEKIYILYCSNQANAQRLLFKLKDNNDFMKFLGDCESRPQLNRMKLTDILIQPMQRITRYPILLKRILDYTQMGISDFENLKGVLGSIEKLTKRINESVKSKEAAYRAKSIQLGIEWGDCTLRFNPCQEGRYIVNEKQMTLIAKSNQQNATGKRGPNSEITVLLFNDFLLMCHVSKKKDQEIFTVIRNPIPLNSLAINLVRSLTLFSTINDGSCPNDSTTANQIQILHYGQDSIVLQTVSNTDRLSWCHEVENLCQQQRFINFQRILDRPLWVSDQFQRDFRIGASTSDSTDFDSIHESWSLPVLPHHNSMSLSCNEINRTQLCRSTSSASSAKNVPVFGGSSSSSSGDVEYFGDEKKLSARFIERFKNSLLPGRLSSKNASTPHQQRNSKNPLTSSTGNLKSK